MRSLGPWMSASSVMLRPSAAAALRTLSISGCRLLASPCEKLSRKQSAPARISARCVSTVDDAGPTVAMIFVYLLRPSMRFDHIESHAARRDECVVGSGGEGAHRVAKLFDFGRRRRRGRRGRPLGDRDHVARRHVLVDQLDRLVFEPGDDFVVLDRR